MTSTAQPNLTCIGEPISWLRLETFAAGRDDAAVRTHIAACPACQQCLDEIRADVVALPPLVVAVRPGKVAWWRPFVPVFALAAAAAVVAVLLVGRDSEAPTREDRVAIKGIGEVILGTVRERAGAIRVDARTFAAGDRWKLVVTCAPGPDLHVAVTVVEVGASAIDRPLPPASLACGNQVALPGAFSLTGPRANRVCATISGNGESDTACVTLVPE